MQSPSKVQGPGFLWEKGLSWTGRALSTTSPFSLPVGCSLGVARACPVPRLELVVFVGSGGGGRWEQGLGKEGGPPTGCGQPQKTGLGICHTYPPQSGFTSPSPWPEITGQVLDQCGSRGTSGEGSGLGEGELRPSGRVYCPPTSLSLHLEVLGICSEPGKALLACLPDGISQPCLLGSPWFELGLDTWDLLLGGNQKYPWY